MRGQHRQPAAAASARSLTACPWHPHRPTHPPSHPARPLHAARRSAYTRTRPHLWSRPAGPCPCRAPTRTSCAPRWATAPRCWLPAATVARWCCSTWRRARCAAGCCRRGTPSCPRASSRSRRWGGQRSQLLLLLLLPPLEPGTCAAGQVGLATTCLCLLARRWRSCAASCATCCWPRARTGSCACGAWRCRRGESPRVGRHFGRDRSARRADRRPGALPGPPLLMPR